MNLDIEPLEFISSLAYLISLRDTDRCYRNDETMMNILKLIDKVPDTLEIAKAKSEIITGIDYELGLKTWSDYCRNNKSVTHLVQLQHKRDLIYRNSMNGYGRQKEVRETAEAILKEDPDDIRAKNELIDYKISGSRAFLSESDYREAMTMINEIIANEKATVDDKVRAYERKLRILDKVYKGDEAGKRLETFYGYQKMYELKPDIYTLTQIIEIAFSEKMYSDCLLYIEKYLVAIGTKDDDKLGRVLAIQWMIQHENI